MAHFKISGTIVIAKTLKEATMLYKELNQK